MPQDRISDWGQIWWYARAENIPAQFRLKICCHCGHRIKWNAPIDLKNVKPGFAAHKACVKNAEIIHGISLEEIVTVAVKGSIGDLEFRSNVDRCRVFLALGFFGRMKFHLGILFSKERL